MYVRGTIVHSDIVNGRVRVVFGESRIDLPPIIIIVADRDVVNLPSVATTRISRLVHADVLKGRLLRVDYVTEKGTHIVMLEWLPLDYRRLGRDRENFGFYFGDVAGNLVAVARRRDLDFTERIQARALAQFLDRLQRKME